MQTMYLFWTTMLAIKFKYYNICNCILKHIFQKFSILKNILLINRVLEILFRENISQNKIKSK